MVKGNVTVPASLTSFFAVENPDETYLIHCAGIVSITDKNLELLYKVNYEGTRNIVKLFQKIKKTDYLKWFMCPVSMQLKKKAEGEMVFEPEIFNEKDVVGEYAKSKAKTSSFVKKASKKRA